MGGRKHAGTAMMSPGNKTGRPLAVFGLPCMQVARRSAASTGAGCCGLIPSSIVPVTPACWRGYRAVFHRPRGMGANGMAVRARSLGTSRMLLYAGWLACSVLSVYSVWLFSHRCSLALSLSLSFSLRFAHNVAGYKHSSSGNL